MPAVSDGGALSKEKKLIAFFFPLNVFSSLSPTHSKEKSRVRERERAPINDNGRKFAHWVLLRFLQAPTNT